MAVAFKTYGCIESGPGDLCVMQFDKRFSTHSSEIMKLGMVRYGDGP